MGSNPTPQPAARGHYSVARLTDAWFIACRSAALLQARPLAVTLQGVPLVLFRDEHGRPGALEDRCPHRNAPLSAGAVRGGQLQCRYHGWRFDAGGTCRAVPGLPGEPEARATRAAALATAEQDGFVWVHASAAPGTEPGRPPFRFPCLDDRRYTTARREFRVTSTLYAALENTLDVPHTAFLHGGLFRTARKENEIEVVVRRYADRVEAEFIGEPRPSGLAGRVLSPSGGVVEHWDRFFLPSIAQVEYKLGSENHVVITTMCTPVTETRTRMHTTLSLKTRVPVRALAPLIMPIAWKILQQDKWILEAQTALVDRFGTETFSSTPIDLLGPHILHLLKKAEAGALDEAIVREERVALRT